ncbi:MAG: septum site-determining protein MinD [Longicatena sp.]
MGEAIAITSGKGGVGKSSVCVNMGVVLSQLGNRVCLIDVDLGLKNLDVMMGLENRVIYDLMDVMEGRCMLSQAMIKDKVQEHLYLLPACKTVHIEQFHHEDLKVVVEQLIEQFDYVLLDTPAGIERGFVSSIACVNRVVVVTTLDVTALQDADRVIGILMNEGMEHISFVVNRMNVKMMEKGISVPLQEAKQWLAIDFLGYVFDDETMIRANNFGKPVTLQRDTSLYSCFQAIVKRMIGERATLPKIKERSFLAKIFG